MRQNVAFVALLNEYLPLSLTVLNELASEQTLLRCCGRACRGRRQGPLANLRAT